ncbi:TonB-dependent receptor [Dyadobacter sandarakinus]|uniref:TonB-dependent receptor n=2 Tax=Dyadobacter sandarakinus TaxID=2747268 RepID=A0ABX7ID87_9BACT|nr:TonB-dependent receptor [Dyadobacter sandarakinus]
MVCLGSVQAQKTTAISGRVQDAATGQALAYCSVALCNPLDSSVVAGVLAQENGSFSFENPGEGPHYLLVQYVGYQRTLVPVSESPVLIGMQAVANALQEVVVQGARSTIENRADRQVYRADRFLGAQGGTALDVLKNTPSVSVNAEGDITMRGSNGFMVLLNGKPVQTNPSVLLNQLPANTIGNIEIITAPSARFDPDGKAGIINITTKKPAEGTSLVVNAQGGLPSVSDYGNLHKPLRFGGDFIYTIQSGKWEVSLSGNYLRNDIAGRRVGDVNTTIGSVFTSFPSEGERSFIRYNYTARAAVTFTADPQNIFSVGIYNGYRSQSRRADIVYQNTKTDLRTGEILGALTYFNSNIARKNTNITLANFDYTHNFGQKSSVTISALYEGADLKGLTTNLNLAEPARVTILQSTRNPATNPLDAFRIKADYNIRMGAGKLEAGYQYRDQLQKGIFNYLDLDLASGMFVRVPAFSSSTRVANRIHAVYTMYSGKLPRLEYAVGLRYEYAERVFAAEGIDRRELNLSNFFPSLNFQYKLTETWRLKAGYSKRVQRSTNSELNPFPEREHSETFESGDPNILPEFIDLYEAGVVRESGKGSAFANLYHQRIANVVNRVNSVFNDTIINRIYTNAGQALSWGAEAGGTANITRWWQLYAGANVYHYRIKGSLFERAVLVNAAGMVYTVNGNTTFRLSPSAQVQASVSYLSKRVTAQGRDSGFLTPGITAKKTFWSGRLSASLQWQNIDLGLLNSNKQRITTFGRDFFTTTNYIQETDIFLLNVTFNLNQFVKKAKLPGSEFGEREF